MVDRQEPDPKQGPLENAPFFPSPPLPAGFVGSWPEAYSPLGEEGARAATSRVGPRSAWAGGYEGARFQFDRLGCFRLPSPTFAPARGSTRAPGNGHKVGSCRALLPHTP